MFVAEKSPIFFFLRWQKAEKQDPAASEFPEGANTVKQWFIFSAALSRPLICSIYFVMSQLDLDYKRAGKFN